MSLEDGSFLSEALQAVLDGATTSNMPTAVVHNQKKMPLVATGVSACGSTSVGLWRRLLVCAASAASSISRTCVGECWAGNR